MNPLFCVLLLLSITDHVPAEDVRQVFVHLENDENDINATYPKNDPSSTNNATITVIGREVRVGHQDLWDKPVWQFRGIPYAEPPVGDLRFRRPIPKQHLTSEDRDAVVIDASTSQSKACYGYTLNRNSLIDDIEVGWDRGEVAQSMSEDCLYLNVWAPALEREGQEDETTKKHGGEKGRSSTSASSSSSPSLSPVLVEFHGGGYFAGSGDHSVYDGSVLAAAKDVVVVAFNYRLWVFGFLALDIEEAPGNVGLWDAVEALRWIKKNIRGEVSVVVVVVVVVAFCSC